MDGVMQGPPSEPKKPIIRAFVNCCLNCRNKTMTTDAEHEDGGGQPYCLVDGSDISLFQICERWISDR